MEGEGKTVCWKRTWSLRPHSSSASSAALHCSSCMALHLALTIAHHLIHTMALHLVHTMAKSSSFAPQADKMCTLSHTDKDMRPVTPHCLLP